MQMMGRTGQRKERNNKTREEKIKIKSEERPKKKMAGKAIQKEKKQKWLACPGFTFFLKCI